MAADQMEAKPNVLMGKYELGRLLGQGTFAKVYHARNLKTGKSVAIKAMDKEKITRAGMIDQIKREISVMKIVRHPNIVQLFEVMASKSKIYFVMEYVKGGELFDRVAKGRLPEGEARKYFQQLISAVDFCHSRGVYHRDLKPENLLLDENGNLKISDFGLSALPEQLKQDGLLHTACGTPSYVAPEVLLKKGYDGAKADIWSCGVILFVLMAGFLPFHDENLMAMYKKIYKGEFKCPPWFSAEVRRVLSKLLVPNPKARIAIPQLMETTWFKRGFKRERSFNYIDEDETSLEDVNSIFSGSNAQLDGSSSSSSSSASVKNEGLAGDGAKPACMNAFDIISLSPGFNLAGLFDDEKHRVNQESRFTTTQPASNVISKLEEIGKLRGFNTKKTDCKVKLQGSEEGRKGHLSVAAEVFQVTPALFLVEVKKAAGDTLEYNKFCKQELRPGLKDIVWTWHEYSR